MMSSVVVTVMMLFARICSFAIGAFFDAVLFFRPQAAKTSRHYHLRRTTVVAMLRRRTGAAVARRATATAVRDSMVKSGGGWLWMWCDVGVTIEPGESGEAGDDVLSDSNFQFPKLVLLTSSESAGVQLPTHWRLVPQLEQWSEQSAMHWPRRPHHRLLPFCPFCRWQLATGCCVDDAWATFHLELPQVIAQYG